MREFTLDIGDKLYIGGEVMIEHLRKKHPKAITAQMVRLGVQAPRNIKILCPAQLYQSKKMPIR